MRFWLLAVACTACAATARTCPTGAHLANADRPSGRVEFCTTTVDGVEEMPVSGRTADGLIGVAVPSPMSGGLEGPYTHWYPNGAVESAGAYVHDGATSVPDGLWAFWYPDGTRKAVGRYQRGHSVGCFAQWDERGNEVTGIVSGSELRVQRCAPPADDQLVAVEERSHPREARAAWGDAAMHALAEAGAFGLSNASQVHSNPAPTETLEVVVHKNLGGIRLGPVLGLRLSDAPVHAYTAGVSAAYSLPLGGSRFSADVDAQLGIQYFDMQAQRTDTFPSNHTGLWAPIAGARLGVSFALSSTIDVTAGARVDGFFSYDEDQPVEYFIGAPTMETWTVGGLAYGLDVGLRARLR